MSGNKGLTRKLTLQQLFFLLLMLSGVIPLAIISLLLIGQNRDVLETQEKTNLTRSARSLSVELNDYFSGNRKQLDLLGSSILVSPGAPSATTCVNSSDAAGPVPLVMIPPTPVPATRVQ